MRVLSPLLNRVVYPALGKTGYLSSRTSAAVVTYHGVLPDGYESPDTYVDDTLISLEAFRTQIGLLKRNYELISPGHFQRWLLGEEDLPKRAVLLTCDDGLLNNLTVMLPVLLDEKLECLFFVTATSLRPEPEMLWYIELYLMLLEAQLESTVDLAGVRVHAIPTDLPGKRSRWLQLMDQLSRLDSKCREEFMHELRLAGRLQPDWKKKYLNDPFRRQRFQLLGLQELNQLSGAGMTIGAHTVSHPALSRQSDSTSRKEIIESRNLLATAIGSDVWALAYPYGNPATVGDREMRFAQEAGYLCAFMNVPGNVTAAERFSLPRAHVTASMNSGTFEANVSGFHEAMRRKLRPSQCTASTHT